MLKINPVVFFTSAAIVVLFVILGAAFPGPMNELFAAVQDGIVTNLGWLYILAVAFFLLFVLWLMLGPYAHVRLGKDDDEPEYSTLTWFAMLFSAGMGIGLLFFSVAEPVMHFGSPHVGPSGSEAIDTAIAAREAAAQAQAAGNLEAAQAALVQAGQAEAVADAAARQAMNITFFHWGLHAWAIYIVVGLSLAYFAYRHDLPLTIRSTLYPLFGERIYGPIGNTVDILAVFGTLFGVATSLGLGAQQVNAGMEYLGLVDVSLTAQIGLIVVITIMATISVVSGLDVGIRRLSELNMIVGLLLILFVFIAGPTVFLLSSFVQGIGRYIQTLPEMTFRTDAFRGVEWQKSWTMFYWGWWISWSPFVGMFIARVSRGRTIREFILGVLFAPTLLAFAWMVIFGNTAIHMELTGQHAVAAAVSDNLPTALYVMLERLPLSAVSATLATIVIATYFITSSDSASLVVDILTANGDPDPPVAQRIFWALTEGAVAAVLLLTGGLMAIRTAAITTALPLSLILLLICYSLVKGLRGERVLSSRPLPAAPAGAAVPPGETHHTAPADTVPETPEEHAMAAKDWRAYLREILDRKQRAKQPPAPDVEETRRHLAEFIENTVAPAFEAISEELEKHGRETVIDKRQYHATITVMRDGEEEFSYAIRSRAYHKMSFAFPEFGKERKPSIYRAEVVLRSGARHEREVRKFTKEAIIRDFLDAYARWIGW